MSHGSAIHIKYRISLRSSSMQEPRDPLLKVVFILFSEKENTQHFKKKKTTVQDSSQRKMAAIPAGARKSLQFRSNNDPSAGSPTERFYTRGALHPLGPTVTFLFPFEKRPTIT